MALCLWSLHHQNTKGRQQPGVRLMLRQVPESLHSLSSETQEGKWEAGVWLGEWRIQGASKGKAEPNGRGLAMVGASLLVKEKQHIKVIPPVFMEEYGKN